MEEKGCAACKELRQEINAGDFPALMIPWISFLTLTGITITVYVVAPPIDLHPFLIAALRGATTIATFCMGAVLASGKFSYYYQKPDGSYHTELELPAADKVAGKSFLLKYPLRGIRRGAVLQWEKKSPNDRLIRIERWRVRRFGNCGGVELTYTSAGSSLDFRLGLTWPTPALLWILGSGEAAYESRMALQRLHEVTRERKESIARVAELETHVAELEENLQAATEAETKMGRTLAAIAAVAEEGTVARSVYGKAFSLIIRALFEKIRMIDGYKIAPEQWASEIDRYREEIMGLINVEKERRRAKPAAPAP